MRTELLQFKDKLEGQDVFLIGGGASTRNFDFSLLENKNTIVINSMIEKIKSCAAIFWTDNDWAAQNLEKIDKIKCLKFSVRAQCDQYIKKGIRGIGESTVLKKMGDYGFSTDINGVFGNNSGAQVLNLVSNAKPHRIILLGYDMRMIDGQSHSHDQYIMSKPSIYDELFIPSINIMAPIIEKLGIEVINCSLKSKLNCFRKDSIENYL